MKMLCEILSIILLAAAVETKASVVTSDHEEKERKSEDTRYKTYHGVSSAQGERPSMEDAHTHTNIPGYGPSFYLFDGHGEEHASKFASTFMPYYMIKNVVQQKSRIPAPILLKESFIACHKAFVKAIPQEPCWVNQEWELCGTTALVAMLDQAQLFIAHAGDTRAVLCKAGKVAFYSQDHKPSNPQERERLAKLGKEKQITKNGLYISNGNGGRLAVTRALGYISYDVSGVIPDPEVASIDLDDHAEFIIMACDGLWDKVTNEAAVWNVQQFLAEHQGDYSGAAQMLQETVLAADSGDNVTVMVVDLKGYLKDLRASSEKQSKSVVTQESSDSVVLS